MEFLRFGSSIPGSYWGCCAVDIIQDFKQDPDAKASIQLVMGDSGQPIVKGGGFVFAGPTYRDIFKQRMRFGTFDSRDMPNHGFIAILTSHQVSSCPYGKKWLAILKEEGFEFIRAVSNSVYTGQKLTGETPYSVSSHPNYIFGLFRNIGDGSITNPYKAPKAWSDLPSVVPEVILPEEEGEAANEAHNEYQKKLWSVAPPPLLTEAQVRKAKAPVIYAGLRSEFPQQSKEDREQQIKLKGEPNPSSGDPFDDCEEDDYEEEYEEEF